MTMAESTLQSLHDKTIQWHFPEQSPGLIMACLKVSISIAYTANAFRASVFVLPLVLY